MSPGYSGTPLVRKLGIRPGMRLLVDAAPRPYGEIVADLPDVELVKHAHGPIDMVHLFATSRAQLERRLAEYRDRIFPDGMIWVSWPKKNARVATDLTEDVVRTAALAAGLVDVKVCAVDDVWSGLKLVIRTRDRAAGR